MAGREKLAEKYKELVEKYADVINDLCVKYDKTTDLGFEMLKAIARAKILNLEPEYSSNIDFDPDELVKDYLEYADIAEGAWNETH